MKRTLMLWISLLLLCTGFGMTAAASDQPWKDAYLGRAQTALAQVPDASFYLIELDTDGIPELIINYASVAGSEEIFWWYQDQLCSWMYEYYGMSYIPGSNLVCIRGGRMGGYYDDIRMRSGNQFYQIASGTYELIGAEPNRDAAGNFILDDQFQYTWAGQPVSAQDYVAARDLIFDPSRAVSPYNDPGYDYAGLLEALNTYNGSASGNSGTSGGNGNASSGGNGNASSGDSSNAEGLQVLGGTSSGSSGGAEGLLDPGSQENSQTGTPGMSAGPQEGVMSFVSSDVSEYPNVKLFFDFRDNQGSPITLTSVTGGVSESIAGGAQIERTIRKIEKLEGNQGLSIDIVADKSGSMDSDLWTMQSIMSEFVTSLDYATGDQVEVISFDSYIMYMCTYTKDIGLLQNGIYNMTAYGDTALYDALYTGIQNAGNQAGARCVIGFTDGADNCSVHTPEEVIQFAWAREVPVYLIGTSGADSYTLSYIAQQTGGYYWSVNSINGVGDILNQIYSGSKDMYCIEYESDPSADPYCARTVTCQMTDSNWIGYAQNVSFQATPAIQQTTHASRYELVRADVTWEQANEACIARGGHLATISSQAEMDQLVNMCEAGGVKYCWLGGYTSVRNGAAFGHWITGEPFAFTAWYPGEPSRNDTDGTPEFYLQLWKVEGAWSWNDQRNDLIATGLAYFVGNLGYICEYES